MTVLSKIHKANYKNNKLLSCFYRSITYYRSANGNPIKRYECKITHVNNGKEQKWTVPKTVCLQIIEQLRKGFTVLKVTRHGEDRTTTYQIEGMQ